MKRTINQNHFFHIRLYKNVYATKQKIDKVYIKMRWIQGFINPRILYLPRQGAEVNILCLG
jgi:hypothetical protein